MEQQFIYVKPGIYHAQPEWNYNTRKNSNKKLAIARSVIAQVTGDFNKDTFEVKLLFGVGTYFSRSQNYGRKRTDSVFYVKKSEAYHDGIVNRIYRKLKANVNKDESLNRDPNLKTEFLLVNKEGTYFTQRPVCINIDKMMLNKGQQVVYEFASDVFVEQKDLKPFKSSRIETLVIAKTLAKEFGASVTNEEDFEDDSSYIPQVEIDMMKFYMSGNVSGSFYINKNKLKDLKKDLEDLYTKYAHPKLDMFSAVFEMTEESDFNSLMLSEEEIHVIARNMGLNVEQILLDKKGTITGKKFGI
jgi:hypothetical protein